MIKVSADELDRMEANYPGIRAMIEAAEGAEYPPCPQCGGSNDVASVMVGVIGRTMAITFATTRRKLIPNGDGKGGSYYCGQCDVSFDPIVDE